MKKKVMKSLWVFGNAVQDITVEVDIERLTYETNSNIANMILLDAEGPKIREGLRVKTQIGPQQFVIPIELKDAPLKNHWYKLVGGKKLTLKGDIEALKKKFKTSF